MSGETGHLFSGNLEILLSGNWNTYPLGIGPLIIWESDHLSSGNRTTYHLGIGPLKIRNFLKHFLFIRQKMFTASSEPLRPCFSELFLDLTKVLIVILIYLIFLMFFSTARLLLFWCVICFLEGYLRHGGCNNLA